MANFRKFGEIQGSTTAAQLPDVPFSTAWLKARDDNVGNVYIGGSGVTLPDGTTDITTGLEVGSDQYLLLSGPGNLNQYYRICNNAGDDLTYMVEG